MMYLLIISVLVCLLQVQGAYVYPLEHSLQDDEFTSRGSVEIHYNPSPGGKIGTVSYSNSPLSQADLASLQELSSTGRYYRIRLVLPNGQYLVSSVPACAFLSSNLKEVSPHSTLYN